MSFSWNFEKCTIKKCKHHEDQKFDYISLDDLYSLCDKKQCEIMDLKERIEVCEPFCEHMINYLYGRIDEEKINNICLYCDIDIYGVIVDVPVKIDIENF